jgi:hypothetical protein
MPIRFPTEAANDPAGPLNGMPESTGEDDTQPESDRGRAQDPDRGRARDRPQLRERGTRETNRDDTRKDGESPKRER